MSKNKTDDHNAKEKEVPKVLSMSDKMEQIYQTAIQSAELRHVVTFNIEARNKKVAKLIADQEDYFRHETEEVDVKPLIRKWRGALMKDEIHNLALNHLYVNDPNMNKKDLERNLKLLNDNIDVMGTTDGFKRIEKQIGLNDKILQKSSTVSALKPMRELEPFSGHKVTYSDKKQQQDQVRDTKLAEANELMNKLLEEKKARKQKMKEIRMSKKNNKDKREASRLKRLEDEEEKKKKENEEKRKEIEDRIKNIENERQRSIQEMIENTKKIEKPKFRSIQNNYKEKVLMPNLDQKKKALASIRDLHRPISLEEINEHKKRIDEIIEKRRKEHEAEQKPFDYDYKKFETNWINSVKEQDLHQKEEQEKKEGEKKELYDKMRSYGDMVKEMHWPSVSKKKQLEMELLKQSLKHPIKKGLNGSGLSSQHLSNRRSTDNLLGANRAGFQSDIEEEHSTTIKRRKIIWKDNPMVPKPHAKKEANVIDWLQERRRQREEDRADGRETHSSPIRNWNKDIEEQHLNQQEKYDYIKERTKQLEEDARRKEEMITLAKAGTIEDRDKINDMIFESIKAKLGILEDFNS